MSIIFPQFTFVPRLVVQEMHLVITNQREIEIYVLNTQNNHLTIGIKDTGQGFPSDIIERLFTPFITTKPVGLGLGLNICRTIMTTFHGQIYLASSLQQGALIVLELNYAQE